MVGRLWPGRCSCDHPSIPQLTHAGTMSVPRIKKKKIEKAAGEWGKEKGGMRGVLTIGLIAISPSALSLDVT